MVNEHEETAGLIADIVRSNDVYLGGSAVGKGFRRAARYYLQTVAPEKNTNTIKMIEEESPSSSGDDLLNPDIDIPHEESFYVVDIGVVVSQFYQWRKHFPRVYPYYAVKCNPDPVIIQTLATLGANFDCASRQEIQLVQDLTKDLPTKRKPEIIYANPCKARSHICEAIRRGVTMMTYDNTAEVKKCASVSSKIKLILRIITDDSGSQCRLSSKFGAPRAKWMELLGAAKKYGLEVVGVSFHVGSGCRDASRYDMALRDAKELFAMAKEHFGFEMNIVDIGGGFPGETHSLWNPASMDEVAEDEDDDLEEDDEKKEGDGDEDRQYMFFNEIADHVAPVLDDIFPEGSGVQLIAEPGRYLVAASSTLLVNVVAVRSNVLDDNKAALCPISDKDASKALADVTRDEETEIVNDQATSFNADQNPIMQSIVDELADYSALFARQNLVQQEVEVYTDGVDFSAQSLDASMNLLAGPTAEETREEGKNKKPVERHTAEGMTSIIVAECMADGEDDKEGANEVGTKAATGENGGDNMDKAMLALASAGEAAVAGVVVQSIADISPSLQDDFSYYVNDGVYGGFNNIMFDHAVVRPRVLRNVMGSRKNGGRKRSVSITDAGDGFKALEYDTSGDDSDSDDRAKHLYSSTIFGPTCDSIDVISRSVLLPKLDIGSWLYFNNMGAYTMAAASSFNGFAPTEKFYVCSVQPEHFETFAAGPEEE